MSSKITPRANRPETQDLHSMGTQPKGRRAPRDAKAKRAPRRIWASQQMQQGATMAYQQGFTSGPSS